MSTSHVEERNKTLDGGREAWWETSPLLQRPSAPQQLPFRFYSFDFEFSQMLELSLKLCYYNVDEEGIERRSRVSVSWWIWKGLRVLFTLLCLHCLLWKNSGSVTGLINKKSLLYCVYIDSFEKILVLSLVPSIKFFMHSFDFPYNITRD